MRTVHLLFIFIVIYYKPSIAQTLPPVAQQLYDEAYNQDSLIVQYAINNNAQIIPTPDGNSFYIQWFPNGSNASNSPLIITLHGSDGYAFHEFFNWHNKAELHGCGIIAIQWYRGNLAVAPNDYFNETSIYSYIDSALTAINYPSNSAFLHGFSRGSARTYAIVLKDLLGGKNYFCTTLSNAGAVDSSYPIYAQIDSGIYGNTVYLGKHWNLFCGGLDSNPSQSGCIGMNNTKLWLEDKGAIVDIFIEDDTLGHNGFHTVPNYLDSVLDNYISCFNGTLSVSLEQTQKELRIYPNPFTEDITIQSSMPFKELYITNIWGQTVARFDENRKTVNLSFLPNGLYYVILNESKNAVTRKKIVKR